MFKLDFQSSDYGEDFEYVYDWPRDWPCSIEHTDGSIDYDDGDVWFKAYDTSFKENDEDAELFELGYLFNCIVRIRYYTTGLYCEDVLAKFPAKDKEEAEHLLQVAADALYGEEW